MITISEAWKVTYPGATVGFLAMHNAANPEHHEALDQRKEWLEAELRTRFAGADRAALVALPTIQAYSAYYGQFRKTYHVLLQLESVALKNRPIARATALVEAMFIAELKNQLLTAGHDLTAVERPVTVGVATGKERYTMLTGKEQILTTGDMFMADRQGVISAVLHGPDGRTRITPATRDVLFAVYAPAGISSTAVHEHLQDIQSNVALLAPGAETELLEVYTS
jgi:DNA/RNA-binding domain of Phe-tRNA-synthetase-like protein